MARSQLALAAALLAFAFAALAPGCIPEEQKTLYGGPEGLAGRQLPKPLNPTGPQDASTTAPGACPDGGQPLAGTGCTVSWKNDIFTYLKATGHCGDTGCHQPGGQTPAFDVNSADNAYNSLAAYTSSTFQPAGKRYIDPCSTTPEDSAITCNLTPLPGGGKAACEPLMPLTTTGGTVADPAGDFLTNKLPTWLKCGAPNN